MQVQEGQRIVQPRLRHRFQEDRHGLTRSRARLRRQGDDLTIDFDEHGTGLQLMLGAVYAAGELARRVRGGRSMDAIRKGMRWTGTHRPLAVRPPVGNGRRARLDGRRLRGPGAVGAADARDHRVGQRFDAHLPDRKAIQRRFRDLLRDAHPDHGGDTDDAAQRINDLTEARTDPAVVSRPPDSSSPLGPAPTVTTARSWRSNDGLDLPVERITIRSRAVRKVHEQLRADMDAFADRLGADSVRAGHRRPVLRRSDVLDAGGCGRAGRRSRAAELPAPPAGKARSAPGRPLRRHRRPGAVRVRAPRTRSPRRTSSRPMPRRSPVRSSSVWLDGEPHSPRDDAAVVAAVAGWLGCASAT